MKLGQRIQDHIMWRLGRSRLPRLIQDLIALQPTVLGDPSRLVIDKTAQVHKVHFNVVSGTIRVDAYASIAQGASVLTGSHDVTKLGADRQTAYPTEGRDVVIQEGAWIASNATVLGPCIVGEHAVVAAGSLVRHDVPPYAIVAGVPAEVVGDVRDHSRGQERGYGRNTTEGFGTASCDS